MAIKLNDADLRIIKQLELEIALEIKRICDKNNIKYSVAYGTLLGAVRHGGFIPWDDDIDIAMLRTEYDKFLLIAKNNIDSKYEIVNYETNSNFGEPFTKIMRKDTVMLESFAKYANAPCGVFVDIFPFDNAPVNVLLKYKHRFINYELRKRILLSSNYSFNKTGIKNFIYYLLKISASGKKSKLIKSYRKNQSLYNEKETKYVVALGGNYGYRKEILPRKWFDDFVYIEFEGVMFSAFKHMVEFLQHYYDDYMKLPPTEEQVNKHAVEVLDLSLFGGGKYGELNQ